MVILVAEWKGALKRRCNSNRPLVFTNIILTKKLGVRRAREIRVRITSIMDLWERGLHIGLVGDAEVEGNVRDIRADGGGEDEDESIAWKFHRSVLSGKLRQAVCRATVGEGGRCLLPEKLCTKAGRPVA